MTQKSHSRRGILKAVGAIGVTTLGGCLSSTNPGQSEPTDSSGASETPTDRVESTPEQGINETETPASRSETVSKTPAETPENRDSSDGANMVPDPEKLGDETIHGDGYELKQFAVSTGNSISSPKDGLESKGLVRLFGSTESALDWLPFGEVKDSQRPKLRTFVKNTDFETTVLLYVELRGPHSGTRTIAIDELNVEGNTISGTAKVNQISDGGLEAITYSAALIRVHATATHATITAIDGWNGTTELQSEMR